MKFQPHKIWVGLCVLCAHSAFAAPTGYSVNADAVGGDELHAINLETGLSSNKGLVQSVGGTFSDVEGLAMDADGVLWAVDDESLTLFPVSKVNGTVDQDESSTITGLDAIAGNDFGMTFTCSGDLYISSVAGGALYVLAANGSATRVGNLGANISALASIGKPVRLYGLGNGLQGDGSTEDNRSLYEIDPATASTTLVGTLGPAAGAYFEAGLSFDSDGTLWAITDRKTPSEDLGSEILRLDLDTGAATLVSTTGPGFESLAVAPPSACEDVMPPVTPGRPSDTPRIPTLDFYGKLASILVLLATGLLVLRSRP